MTLPGLALLLALVIYWVGFRDGDRGRPPPPLKGTYDSGDHEDEQRKVGEAGRAFLDVGEGRWGSSALPQPSSRWEEEE